MRTTTSAVTSFEVSGATSTTTEIYYILSDHLNTPRKLTNATGTVLWSWNSDAFGTTLANQDVDGDGTDFEFNLRFPGQYFDKESTQHYNYFRDYEPGTGRYLESDPIGLRGGENSYLYSGGNSILYFDSKGLFKVIGCDDCNNKNEAIKSIKNWCKYIKNGSFRITDVSVRKCVLKKCRNAKISCGGKNDKDCNTPATCGGKPTSFRAFHRVSSGEVKICLNKKPSIGGWGSTVIHEFEHTCGVSHDNSIGMPNQPNLEPNESDSCYLKR